MGCQKAHFQVSQFPEDHIWLQAVGLQYSVWYTDSRSHFQANALQTRTKAGNAGVLESSDSSFGQAKSPRYLRVLQISVGTWFERGGALKSLKGLSLVLFQTQP